jgi:hypothetical protein
MPIADAASIAPGTIRMPPTVRAVRTAINEVGIHALIDKPIISPPANISGGGIRTPGESTTF